jgi:hypothetical protein
MSSSFPPLRLFRRCAESISSVALFNRETHLQLRRSEVPAATLRLSGLRKVVTRLRTVRARREQSGC